MKHTLIIAIVLATCLLAIGQGGVGVDAQGDALPTGAIARIGSLRFRHDAAITCQAVSNNGKLIATGGGRTVRVWEADTGRQRFVLTISQNARAAAPSAVAFSPDSQMLAALGAYGQGMITVWDLRGGQSRQELMLPQRDDYSNTLMDAPFLAFGSNNKTLLIKNYSDKAIRLIDVDSGQDIRLFQDTTSAITAIAVSFDGNWLATGTENRQVILWDVKTGKEVHRLAHEYPLVSLAFSRDGQSLATLDQDLAPRIWNLATGKEQLALPARTRSVALSWSLDGQTLYVGRQPDQLLSWTIATKKEESTNVPRGWVAGPIYTTRTNDHGEAFVFGSPGRRGNNSAKLRRVELSQLAHAQKFDGYDSGNVYGVYLAHHKQWATIGTTGDNILRLWDSHGKLTKAIKLPVTEPAFRSFAVNAEGTFLALSSLDGRILVVDTVTEKIVHTINAFSRACFDTEFSADGQSLIATDLKQVKVFQLNTGAETKSYELNAVDTMRSIISPDGSRIASMVYVQDEEQFHFRVLDARTGKVLTQENKLPIQQNNFFFSPDGRNVITMGGRSRNAGFSMIEAASGKTRLQIELPSPYLYLGSHARISPDGRWLVVTASGPEPEQYAAIGWRIGEKRDPAIFQGHRGIVQSVNFSADSKQLITVSSDATMLIWDLERYPAVTPLPLDEKGYLRLWQDLGEQDATKAYAAVHRFAHYPEATAWITKRLMEQSTIVQPDMIRLWISQLNAVKFSEREEATRQLTAHAAIARSQLKTAIEQTDTAETRRRLEQILEQARETTGFSENPLQSSRAIEAIELMGTPAALQQLQSLAQRKDALGQEAQESVLRLKHRLK